MRELNCQFLIYMTNFDILYPYQDENGNDIPLENRR